MTTPQVRPNDPHQSTSIVLLTKKESISRDKFHALLAVFSSDLLETELADDCKA